MWWEREPSLEFDPMLQADPRGIVVINVNKKIEATFRSPEGAELVMLEAKTAKEITKKIAQLELLQRSDHMMDIAMELQKAEIALKEKLEYIQDKPLKFR